MSAARLAIAAEIAALPRVVATPVEPFGYGSDVSCAYDMDPGVAELDGMDPLVLKQAIIRRLDTPRGSLPDDPSYGISLRSMVNAGVKADDLTRLAGVIQNEVSKDDRISTLRVEVVTNPAMTELTVTLQVTPADPRLGPFSMTLAVTSAAIVLEAIAS